MDPVRITHVERSGNGWQVAVEVGREDTDEDQFTFNVQVDEDFYTELTGGGGVHPEDLVEETFRFLLERESKESILTNFDLNEVSNYFPEFEVEIKKRVS